MERDSIKDRQAALAEVQRRVQETRMQRPPTAAVPEPPIIKVRRNLGFYDALPWDDVQYFSQDVSVAWPPAGLGPNVLHNYVVPAHQVLDITSVVFRATIMTDPNWFRHIYAADDYLLGRAFFTLSGGGTSIFQRDINEPTFAVATTGDTYNVLNQDIMIPQLPFHMFLNQGTALRVTYTVSGALFLGLPLSALIVELRGLLIPKVLFDRLRKEFES